MSAIVFGFGPLERWLHDETVTEVLVNAGREVWVERRPDLAGGTTGPCGPRFVGCLDPGVLDTIIERILAPIGRRLDRSSPVVDARLPDGSRVCAVLPPIAVDGACLAVRRFASDPFPLDAFAGPAVAALLEQVIHQRCNIVVTGATSSGKTTMLNSLASCISADQRIITLEDTAELQLSARHVLRLETRPATPDGLRAVDLADLLRTALRLRPDRIVVGEIRGSEATQLVQALNTGHDGSLATLHANSPVEALARLESLVVRDSPGWSLDAIRAQVHRSIDVIVHVGRDDRQRRRVLEVVEVVSDVGQPAPVVSARLVDVLARHDERVGTLTRGRR